MKSFFTFFLFSALFFAGIKSSNGQEQYVASVNSSLNYEVTILLSTLNIDAPGTCQWGYNFNVGFEYEIYFTGPDAPSSLYTLQGNMGCGTLTNNNFFQLPNSGGIGNGLTTGNPWNPNSDCLTATPSSLECNAITIQIEGPGIPSQFLPMTRLAALPVSLVNFEVENNLMNQVDLKWSTASEENNDYFTVEHSVDGVVWDSIFMVKGAGSSQELKNYNFIDTKKRTGVNFYRLKQTDFNGLSQYSPIRMIQLKGTINSNSFSVFPNPTINRVNIQGDPAELSRIEFFNSQGESVLLAGSTHNENQVSIDISTLIEGIYFIRTQKYTQKLVVGL